MSVKRWETRKTIYCKQAQAQASLEVQVVYAAEHLPDQPPRVLGHRCSKSLDCVFCGPARCYWTGENPAYDPFNLMA